MSDHLLHRLLDDQLNLPPEYDDQLTSHLPMALHALSALGAAPVQMQAFHDAYRRRFEGRLAPAPAAALDDWRTGLGRFDLFAALQAAFAEALARDGLNAVLRSALPVLWPGLAAAAFHGPIRLAHAVQAGHAGEQAAALAYWAARWQPLPAPGAGAPEAPDGLAPPADVDAWAARLNDSAGQFRSQAPLISLRMAEAVPSAPYQTLAGALPVPADAPARTERLNQLARLALESYAVSRNFTVLHMVTGLRAVRVLAPWLETTLADTGPTGWPVLERAFTAAWLAARLPRLPLQVGRVGATGATGLMAALEDAAPGWPRLLEAACASRDDHLIKLVHACHEQRVVLGDAICRRAAAAAVRAEGG